MPSSILLIVVGIIFLLLLGASYYSARLVIYPKVFPFEATYQANIEMGRLDEAMYTPWPSEAVTFRSPFGYDLAGVYHPVPGSQRTVIVSHGISDSRYGSIIYATMFYKRGYNVLLYDLRHHGQSGGANTSFGFYEKEDLKVLTDWAFARLTPGGIVGTAGLSLGAAVTLQHAGVDPRIAFVLADCAFSDLPKLLSFRMHEDFHLPGFPIIGLASLITRLIAGWYFGQASPIRYVPTIKTPIFFVHGQADTYILPQMGVDLYEAKQCGYRKLYLAPNAGHAESVVKNPVEYDEKLGEFLQEIGL